MNVTIGDTRLGIKFYLSYHIKCRAHFTLLSTQLDLFGGSYDSHRSVALPYNREEFENEPTS